MATATGSLKRGIKYAGLLHLGEHSLYEHSVATLIAVQRGWVGMEPLASKRKFKGYLEEFGNCLAFIFIIGVAVKRSVGSPFYAREHIRH